MVADPLGFIIIGLSLGGRHGLFVSLLRSLAPPWILLINQIHQARWVAAGNGCISIHFSRPTASNGRYHPPSIGSNLELRPSFIPTIIGGAFQRCRVALKALLFVIRLLIAINSTLGH